MRKPTKTNSLSYLRKNGLLPKTIIDVGVQHQTPELISVYPDCKHILVEPVMEYREKIIKNYSGVRDKEFIWAAASSQPGNLYLNLQNKKQGSEKITHSQLTEKLLDNGAGYLVDVITIDSLCAERQQDEPYLLKVDVDGKDLEVLKGSEKTLSNTVCVIIEAPIETVLQRSQYLYKFGFMLYDIVDLCYYRGTLYQVDLIFLRKDVRNSSSSFNPRAYLEPNKDYWEPFNRTLNNMS